MAAISGIIHGDVDKLSNGITFAICNLQKFRYRLFYPHSRIVEKDFAQRNWIFDLPNSTKARKRSKPGNPASRPGGKYGGTYGRAIPYCPRKSRKIALIFSRSHALRGGLHIHRQGSKSSESCHCLQGTDLVRNYAFIASDSYTAQQVRKVCHLTLNTRDNQGILGIKGVISAPRSTSEVG
jgi:hypothetical protein